MPRMIGIGLHHHHLSQMSYSPAASHTAGSNAGRKTNKSPAVKALRVRELSDHDHEQDHNHEPRLESAGVERTAAEATKSADRAKPRRHQLVEVVRAETEMPTLVLDSLDQPYKYRRPAKSRGAASKTLVAAATRQAERNHQIQASSSNNNNNLLTTVDAEQQARHFRRQARRQLEAQRAAAASNQVVLIMSDSSALTTNSTSGVPILGRLLPSKSCGAQAHQNQQLQVCESKPVLMRHVEPIFVGQHQQAPVLGRRSHRLQPLVDPRQVGARRLPSAQWLEQASSPGHSRASRRSTATSSSSCSSLALVRGSHQAGGGELVCLDVCCSRGGPPPDGVRLVGGPLLSEQPPEACLLACCQLPERAGQSHTTCQANGFGLRPSRRSSSLCRLQGAGQPGRHHHHHHQQQQQQQQQRHQRQPPRVPSKPISYQAAESGLNEHKQLLFQYQARSNSLQMQQQQQEHESEAVTQMYESLAAELKAKLGNPNRAPILLPPKDYDTLCRQQGRLSGIETRRSTNPQLVGPKTAASSGGEQQPSAAELEGEPRNCSPSHDSTGRLEPNSDSLQRSRSNSSSGLGSISISAGSPDQAGRSSPSQRSSGSEPDVSLMLKAEHEGAESGQGSPSSSSLQAKLVNDEFLMFGSPVARPTGARAPGKSTARNGRVEVPLKVNNDRRDGNTYLATKQIIY